MVAGSWSVKSPQDYLSGALLIFLSKGGDHRLLKQDGFIWMFPGPVRRTQGAVSRHHQAPVTAVGQQFYLGQVGVALYLSNRNAEIPG